MMGGYSLFQKKSLLPLVLAVLHVTCSSAKSVSPKQTLHLPLAKAEKLSLLKQLTTSENKSTRNETSQLVSEDKQRDGTSTVTTVVRTSQTPNVMSEGTETKNVPSSEDIVGTNLTAHLSVGEGSATPKNVHLVEATPKTVMEDGCSNHRCSAGSRCDSSEGIIHDTGLPYTCRCQRNMFGLFCTIPRVEACAGCARSGFFCLPTTMHWSGRFCYDTTDGWARHGTGACGGRDFSCDNTTRCVPPVALCDGVRDCDDGMDETANCPKGPDTGR